MLVIAHNDTHTVPPAEAKALFPEGTVFHHFITPASPEGYLYYAQVDIAGAENIGYTRRDELQWVEFENYKIGG